MFIRAIEIAAEFTRPMHIIQRTYESIIVQPGAATLFIVNSDGWALTCRHVAEFIPVANQIAQKHSTFLQEFTLNRGKKKDKQIRRELEKKYQYTNQTTIEIKNLFVNCVEGKLDLDIISHPNVDVALIHFKNFSKLICTSFPVFPKDTSTLKQGKFLCRLGFPFPEFTNFEYNSTTDSIQWTKTGKDHTPRFPIEGMLTRHLLDSSGKVFGFELSTAGLRGQSGGPAFDTDGRVWGMQSATNHLDLDFDIHKDVIRNGQLKKVTDYAFLHVGHCIHVDVLKEFMRNNNVTFAEI